MKLEIGMGVARVKELRRVDGMQRLKPNNFMFQRNRSHAEWRWLLGGGRHQYGGVDFTGESGGKRSRQPELVLQKETK